MQIKGETEHSNIYHHHNFVPLHWCFEQRGNTSTRNASHLNISRCPFHTPVYLSTAASKVYICQWTCVAMFIYYVEANYFDELAKGWHGLSSIFRVSFDETFDNKPITEPIVNIGLRSTQEHTLLAKKVVTPPLKTIKPMWIELLCFHLAEIGMIWTRDCSPTKSDTTLDRHSIQGQVGSSSSETTV